MGDISVGSNLQYYEQYFVMMERNTIFIIVISLNEMTKYAYLVDFRLLFNLLAGKRKCFGQYFRVILFSSLNLQRVAG